MAERVEDEGTRLVSVVLFEGFELLDVFGPVELLFLTPGITVEYAGPAAGPVASSQGGEVVAQRAYGDLDILLVPGGIGTRRLVSDEAFLSWLRVTGDRSAVVTSVCTGSALLAAAGLLDGYRATSNKARFAWASGFGASVDWVPQARWVHDRDRWTSSGVAAGMDMAAALIADLRGPEAARAAARLAEYEPRTDAGRDPFAAIHGLAGDTTKVAALFEPEPHAWGLRGDPPLWAALSQHLSEEDIPESAGELRTMLHTAFRDLTGVDLATETADRVYREKFNHGGMSGGQISIGAWRERLMHILIDRAVRLRPGIQPW